MRLIKNYIHPTDDVCFERINSLYEIFKYKVYSIKNYLSTNSKLIEFDYQKWNSNKSQKVFTRDHRLVLNLSKKLTYHYNNRKYNDDSLFGQVFTYGADNSLIKCYQVWDKSGTFLFKNPSSQCDMDLMLEDKS
jgi:hypothetical protein